MNTISIFKTNVRRQKQADIMLDVLSKTYPGFKINFDLEDCDKILRVESRTPVSGEIISILATKGFLCEELS